MTLNTIVSDLHAVRALLTIYAEEKHLSYEQGLVLSSFYVTYEVPIQKSSSSIIFLRTDTLTEE